MKIAEFVAKELQPYGMEWIQIDDGYYRAFGDWEGNERLIIWFLRAEGSGVDHKDQTFCRWQ